MDFDSLKNQVSNLTLYDLKAGVRKVQNAVMNLTEMESKVREATNADPWGASATLMQEIAQGTHNYQQLNEIMPMIYKRFTDKTAEEWRQIYKSLQLLEFLVKNGSERVIDDARSHLSLLRMLRQFHFIDPNGKDQGVNVRNRSAELVKLLSDVDTIRAERKKARSNRNKYGGVEGGGGFDSGMSGGSRYGGFGSESAGYGNYQGEVYGDGGGFGGRETDFSGTQRRADQFEEYDAEEEGGARPTARPAASRTTAPSSGASKRAKPKAKEPEPDLFDFGEDEPVTGTTNGKALDTASSTRNDFGTSQTGGGDDEDDFDDFQSATSPAVAQPAANSLAALSPPRATSTTTSATQFAAPKPVAPAQTASFNNIFQTPSPAPPSTTPALVSPPSSSVSSPPLGQTKPLQPGGGFKPSGPNYYTSVPAAQSTAGGAFAARPQAATQPSYTSSTSAASLGKPTAKPVGSTGSGDAFGSLWSTASTKAGVQSKQSGKGPDLASLAKAKSEAGIWGAPSAASMTAVGTRTTPQPGATGPSSKTTLGNGLDDLLG